MILQGAIANMHDMWISYILAHIVKLLFFFSTYCTMADYYIIIIHCNHTRFELTILGGSKCMHEIGLFLNICANTCEDTHLYHPYYRHYILPQRQNTTVIRKCTLTSADCRPW